MFLIRLHLAQLSLKVPDLNPLQALGSLQGWSEDEHPPKTVGAKPANERASCLLMGQISPVGQGQEEGLVWKDQMLGLSPRRVTVESSPL